MKFKQVFRDLAILIVFCVGFYLLTQAVNLLANDRSRAVANSAFSQARRDADHFLEKKEYASAIPHLVTLTEQDEFNSHAWYRLGNSYANVARASRNPSLANNLTPDLEKFEENANKAIEAYKKAFEFPRYRSLAKIEIAKLYVPMNEELALRYLSEAVDEGGFSRRNGPRKYKKDFSPLFDKPEFREIERRFFQRRRRSRTRMRQ